MAESGAKKYDPLMRTDQAKTGGLEWHSPKAAPFRVAGLAWFATDRAWRRMPLRPKRPLPPGVEGQADQCAGVQIGFQSDSAHVSVRVKLKAPANMDHMPATGQCGFDCYIGPAGEQHYFRTVRYDRNLTAYEYSLFEGAEPALRNFTLNFPLYQAVEEVNLGLDARAQVLPPPPFALGRPTVVYGTSITQGGCASRPGMAWTNILSRRLNVEVINLGFSGSGKGEPEVAETISEIPNPACIILDYEANAGFEGLKKTFTQFIRILRESHAKVPILAVSRTAFAADGLIEKMLKERIETREFMRGVIGELRRGGDRFLFFQDGGELLGADFEECTVDGVHTTDLGFMRIADGLTPVVRGILGL